MRDVHARKSDASMICVGSTLYLVISGCGYQELHFSVHCTVLQKSVSMATDYPQEIQDDDDTTSEGRLETTIRMKIGTCFADFSLNCFLIGL